MPGTKNRQRGFPRLVNMQNQDLSNKDHLNILKDENEKRRSRQKT